MSRWHYNRIGAACSCLSNQEWVSTPWLQGEKNVRVTGGIAVSKYVLTALVLCIFALFAYSVTFQSNDTPSEQTELRAEQTKPPPESAKPEQSGGQLPVDTIDSVRGQLQQLTSDVKANSDKIAQIASLRSELLGLIQDSKSNRDETA